MSGEGGIHESQVSIRDLSEQFGLTPRAIRFYEERGLITSSRDRFNWRRYGVEARRKLALIVALRSADVRIDEIRHLIQTTDRCEQARRRAVISCLERRLASLDIERARVLVQLERLRSHPLAAPLAGGSTPPLARTSQR